MTGRDVDIIGVVAADATSRLLRENQLPVVDAVLRVRLLSRRRAAATRRHGGVEG